ncbi:MAG: BamA/TamA family outer membrane protein [Bacteroidetes bacterium]|nr:BamA/TamA family outer membrane protein [Bacteroidota bacterium]
MPGKNPNIILFLSIMLILAGCSTTKPLKENEYLLTKNTVNISSNKKYINTEELRGYISQKPNKKLFGLFRFKLWSYQKATKGRDSRFNRWVMNTIGERATLYDSLSARESAGEIKAYLQNLGFFDAEVHYTSEKFKHKKKKIKAIYNIEPGEPYRYRNIRYRIDDRRLASFVFSDTSSTLLRKNQIYNAYTMDSERDRITTFLNNNGYYRFTKEYILYEIDSSLNKHQVDARIVIENVSVPDRENPGTLIRQDHDRYFISKVVVNPDFDPLESRKTVYDTLVEEVHQVKDTREANYYYILYKGKLKVSAPTIAQSIFIENKEPFNLRDVQRTYRRFSSLPVFNYTSIQFAETPEDSLSKDHGHKQLNCLINLSRAPLQSYTIEAEGTNSGGDLGIGANLTFQNKNIFRGGEVFTLRLKGALEAQKVSTIEEGEDKTFFFFNTYEYGVEANLTFPKFLIPIRQDRFPKYFRPKTTLSSGINYQNRPKYKRYIATVAFGYEWNESDTKKHILYPADVNLVKVYPTAEFEQEINDLEDDRLRNQYTDHLIMALRYSYVFNNQDIRKLKNFIYFRGNIETSGNLLNLIDRAVSAPRDPAGYYTLFGIRYSQYIRTDFDFRYYWILKQNNSLVYRAIFGIGVPYGNTQVLPFEKGFYLGGANGMRGWRFRSLGPGAYTVTDDDIDKSGDIQLEANVEYRFPIYKFFKGALFVDAGNVWLLKPNETFPGGEFRFDSFLGQMAIDAGIGFRFDFSFFIFRIDAATKFKDPSYPPNDRWVVSKMQLRDVMWNFGIGYPF